MDPFTAIAGLGIGAIIIISLIGLIASIFWIFELIDILRREFRDPIMKIVWLAVVFFSHIVGALIYYFIGKQQGTLPGQSPRY